MGYEASLFIPIAIGIVSKIDIQKFDNAINVAVKEISTRYDFNTSKTKVDFDKKTMMVHVLTENDMRMKAVEGIIIGRVIKQGIDAQVLDFGKELYASGNMVKKDINLKQGVDKVTAKKIVGIIKESAKKVQASIMDEQVRVTGKNIDDLQEVIAILEKSEVGMPLKQLSIKSENTFKVLLSFIFSFDHFRMC